MENSEIYKRTLRFSLMKLLCSIIGVLVVIALPVIGFVVLAGQGEEVGLIGAGVGLILGLIVYGLIARYAGYLFRAGQIAMIAEGVDKGELPEDTYAAGKQEVKKRFVTASVYFALMGITRGISTEITNGINALTSALDGPGGNGAASAVGGVISAVIAVVLTYVNYCSLGWVFLHKNQSSFKSTCDGAVIYFQNWKTLLVNAAQIIGFTLVSLLVIGGAFSGLAYVIFGALPGLSSILADMDKALDFVQGTCFVSLAVIVGVLFWSGLHSAFVEPYILVGVLCRYVEAGRANPPKVDLYGKLSGISKSFRKALDKEKAEGGTAA